MNLPTRSLPPRALLAALGLTAAVAFAAQPEAQAPPAPTPAPATAPASPASPAAPDAPPAKPALPAADPALQPLTFLAGQWIGVNPNQTVNREHWMAPSGKFMSALFTQIRRDGFASFYEVSTIVAEKDGVMLYHRHLHRQLEVEERRKDVDVFRLQSVEAGKAVFVPVKDVEGGIATMTYRVDGLKLLQELAFKPGSKERDFTSTYTRE